MLCRLLSSAKRNCFVGRFVVFSPEVTPPCRLVCRFLSRDDAAWLPFCWPPVLLALSSPFLESRSRFVGCDVAFSQNLSRLLGHFLFRDDASVSVASSKRRRFVAFSRGMTPLRLLHFRFVCRFAGYTYGCFVAFSREMRPLRRFLRCSLSVAPSHFLER